MQCIFVTACYNGKHKKGASLYKIKLSKYLGSRHYQFLHCLFVYECVNDHMLVKTT